MSTAAESVDLSDEAATSALSLPAAADTVGETKEDVRSPLLLEELLNAVGLRLDFLCDEGVVPKTSAASSSASYFLKNVSK